MALQFTTVDVESRFNVTIPNELLYHDPAVDKLIVMLPGRGYTCNHPVLHYVRKMGLGQGFDVLSQQYGFQVANSELTAETMPYLLEDARRATRMALAHGYRRLCVVGKSLGTPLAVQLAKDVAVESVSLILLTPVGAALHELEGIRTLAVIGTADSLYSPEVIAEFEGDPLVRWCVFEYLNHGLEVENDWQESVRALGEVIAACEQFLVGWS